MRHITDKEIAELLGITEKSYIYQGKTKIRIELVCNELIKRLEEQYNKQLKDLKEEIIRSIKAL